MTASAPAHAGALLVNPEKATQMEMNASKAREFAFGDVSGRYGAPMGRHDIGQMPEGKLYAFAAKCVSGGYDEGGAYWGTGGREGWVHAVTDGHSFRRYVRAHKRSDALAEVLASLPDDATWHGPQMPDGRYSVAGPGRAADGHSVWMAIFNGAAFGFRHASRAEAVRACWEHRADFLEQHGGMTPARF